MRNVGATSAEKDNRYGYGLYKGLERVGGGEGAYYPLIYPFIYPAT